MRNAPRSSAYNIYGIPAPAQNKVSHIHTFITSIIDQLEDEEEGTEELHEFANAQMVAVRFAYNLGLQQLDLLNRSCLRKRSQRKACL